MFRKWIDWLLGPDPKYRRLEERCEEMRWRVQLLEHDLTEAMVMGGEEYEYKASEVHGRLQTILEKDTKEYGDDDV